MQEAIQGTQVVGRISRVLRSVSEAMPEGIGTSEVAKQTGLARPTVHRLLAALAAEGFVDHDHRAGLWLLGPELYLMGSVAAERYDITGLARANVQELAQQTGESAFLSALRGNETVCVLRQDGSFPIRSFVLYEGVRFPLGVASAGLAILSFMPESSTARYLANTDLAPRYGEEYTAEGLRRRVDETRAAGYAVNPGMIVPGSWGVGAAVFDAAGQPAWALSLTGIEARFPKERLPVLGRLLMDHAHSVSQKLRNA